MVPGSGQVIMTTLVGITKKKENVAVSSSKLGKKIVGTTMMMPDHLQQCTLKRKKRNFGFPSSKSEKRKNRKKERW